MTIAWEKEIPKQLEGEEGFQNTEPLSRQQDAVPVALASTFTLATLEATHFFLTTNVPTELLARSRNGIGALLMSLVMRF